MTENRLKIQYFFDRTKNLWKIEVVDTVINKTIDFLYGLTKIIALDLISELEHKYSIKEQNITKLKSIDINF